MYNVTDAVVEAAVNGAAGRAGGNGAGLGADHIPFSGVLDIAASKEFELRHWASSGGVDQGGYVTSKRADLDIVYSEIVFERISA